jgi:hypothetical protein
MPPPSAPVPGWYADPEQPAMQRYWDGTAWSEQRRPAQVVAVTLPGPVPAPAASNGFAITALVLGIVGAVFGFIPFTFWLAWILGVLAIVFGALGRRRADQEAAAGKRSMATAGLVLGIVCIVLGVIGLIVLTTLFSDVGSTIEDLDRCLSDPNDVNCD